MDRIKILRNAQVPKMSQEKLANLVGVGRTTVTMWENGLNEPDNSMLIKLAEIFDVSTDYLLGRTEQKKVPTPTNGDGLNEEQIELVKLFESASPALRAAALAVLKSAEDQNKAPGGVSTAE